MTDPTPTTPQLTHPRQAIREKVAALLLGRTEAGQRVWPSRMRHLSARKLPAIGVYTLEDSAQLADVSPRRYDRTATVLVECIATADENLDNLLDLLCAQVEAVLLADKTWGGVADDSALTKASVSFARLDDGAEPFACLALEFEADYTTRPGQADATTLDDFLTAEVNWDLRPHDPDADPDATDTVTLPQED